MPYTLRDQIKDVFDHLEQGFMTIVKYESYFPSLSRYYYTSIVTKSKKIQKLIKGLDILLLLATTQMVVSGASFYNIVDHVKMAKSILQASHGNANMVYYQGEFKGHSSR